MHTQHAEYWITNMKLLIVDDEERFLQSTKKLLDRKGFDVRTAPGGEECLEILEKERIDVVVLDIKMPGIGGMESLKRIKRRHPTIEVIMLTGHGTGDYAVDALIWGAADFLLKPISMPELIAKVEEAMARRHVLEEKIRLARAIKAESDESEPDKSVNNENRKE